MALHADHDAPVLGQAAFGDIHLRQQFDTRRNSCRQVSGGGVGIILQHAIHPVAQVQAILEGLDVDIRGAHIHRPVNQLVYQPDHRRLAGKVLQVLDEFIVRLAAELVLSQRVAGFILRFLHIEL